MAILSFLLELIFTEYFNLFFVSLSLGFSLSLILIQLTIFKATFQARKFAFTAVASTVIPLLILTIISYSYNNNFLINIYVLFVLILATTIGFKSMFQFSRDWQLLFGKLLKIGSPTLPHDVGMSLLQYVDRIIIAALFGLTIAGQIHVAALIGAIPYLLLSTLSNIWAPAVLEKYKIDYAVGTNFLNKTTKIAALGSGFIALLITFNSDLLLRLFSPLTANDPSLNSVVILMSLSGIIYSAYLRNMHLLTLAGKFQSLLWITPTAIAAQILLIYLLSPIYGLFIVAAANLFAISLQAILTQNVIKGLYPNFSLTKMPLYSILVCSVIIIFYLLY
jgi:O-antigen/teichoic acid export membrane protein